MPLNLDSCITGIFVPGNIGASSGQVPVVRTVPSLDGAAPYITEVVAAADVLDYFMGELLHEFAHATDSYASSGGTVAVSIAEAATAVDTVSFLRVFDEVVGEVAPATDAPSVLEPGVVDADLTETAAADDAVDATMADIGFTGSAMLGGGLFPVVISPSGARQANLAGVMVDTR